MELGKLLAHSGNLCMADLPCSWCSPCSPCRTRTVRTLFSSSERITSDNVLRRALGCPPILIKFHLFVCGCVYTYIEGHPEGCPKTHSFNKYFLCETLFYVLTIITEDKPYQHLHEVKFYTNKTTKKTNKGSTQQIFQIAVNRCFDEK